MKEIAFPSMGEGQERLVSPVLVFVACSAHKLCFRFRASAPLACLSTPLPPRCRDPSACSPPEVLRA